MVIGLTGHYCNYCKLGVGTVKRTTCPIRTVEREREIDEVDGKDTMANDETYMHWLGLARASDCRECANILEASNHAKLRCSGFVEQRSIIRKALEFMLIPFLPSRKWLSQNRNIKSETIMKAQKWLQYLDYA